MACTPGTETEFHTSAASSLTHIPYTYSKVVSLAARRRFAAKRDKMKNMRGKSTDEEEEEEDDEDAEDEGTLQAHISMPTQI